MKKPAKKQTLKRAKSLINAAVDLWLLRNGYRPEHVSTVAYEN